VWFAAAETEYAIKMRVSTEYNDLTNHVSAAAVDARLEDCSAGGTGSAAPRSNLNASRYRTEERKLSGTCLIAGLKWLIKSVK